LFFNGWYEQELLQEREVLQGNLGLRQSWDVDEVHLFGSTNSISHGDQTVELAGSFFVVR